MSSHSAATTAPSKPTPSNTSTDPKTQATKTRILTHMTTDHADSLALYLRRYCLLPPSQIPINPLPPPGTLTLEDITLDHIIISHQHGRNLIPINPPMTSLSEARERLVGMHKDCLSALNLADFKVDKFVLPNKPWQWLTHFSVFITLFTFTLWSSTAFLPENHQFPSLFWSLGGLADWNARLAAVIKDYVLVGLLIIHVSEAVWFERRRLRRYWVERGTGLWWVWTGCVFLGGVAGIWRFDEFVEGLERERERKGKH